MAHVYPLHSEQAVMGVHCEALLMIWHILIGCPFYEDAFHTFQIQGPLQDILEDDSSNMSVVLDYLNSTGFMKHITSLIDNFKT
jgi:hypothetical protein